VEGCDLGNSPLDCTAERFAGRRLFISTTNGTRALQQVKSAPTVLTAALVNRGSVVDYLKTTQPETVWMVGSGWEGSYSLEDSVCAGSIVAALAQIYSLEALVGNDELLAALALFQQWQNNLLGLLHHASHGQRLLRLNNHEDLKFCSQLDILDILPQQREAGVLVSAT
jgi:2-phosphosulfolactate phosphatase